LAQSLPSSLSATMTDDWSAEEADDPRYADRRNFYKVEKWSRDGAPHGFISVVDAGRGIISSGTFSGLKYLCDFSSKTKR
jgi:hypothetical protein